MLSLGSLSLKNGSPARAETLLRGGLDVLLEKLPPDHWEIASARSQLGECLTTMQQYDEAERMLVAGYEGLKATKGNTDRLTLQAVRRIVKLYATLGRKQRESLYRAMLPATK
jgi:serine/threonine-protein kinase